MLGVVSDYVPAEGNLLIAVNGHTTPGIYAQYKAFATPYCNALAEGIRMALSNEPLHKSISIANAHNHFRTFLPPRLAAAFSSSMITAS
jgi:hypothetical protein